MVIDPEARDELNVPLHVYVCLQNKLMYKQQSSNLIILMASQLIPSFRFVLEIFKISTYIFEDFIYLWHISYPLGVLSLTKLRSGQTKNLFECGLVQNL